MNSEQIKRCAEAIRQHGEPIETIISRHLAAAKEAEDDVRWFRDFIEGFNDNGDYRHRLLRIAERLERGDK